MRILHKISGYLNITPSTLKFSLIFMHHSLTVEGFTWSDLIKKPSPPGFHTPFPASSPQGDLQHPSYKVLEFPSLFPHPLRANPLFPVPETTASIMCMVCTHFSSE